MRVRKWRKCTCDPCLWWRPLTSVIIFPLVLFLSRWLALFCFCCSTRSRVVRYSRANSLRILLKRWMLTSRTAYIGWPRNSRKAWNLQMCNEKNPSTVMKTHKKWHGTVANKVMYLLLKNATKLLTQANMHSCTYLLSILRCTIFRIIILSAQSFKKSDIFCFNASFISCLAMTLRWSHDALHLRSIWARLSWSWSKSTWRQNNGRWLSTMDMTYDICNTSWYCAEIA